MKKLVHLSLIALAALWAFAPLQARAQATILPNGETCFQATTATSGGPAGTGTGFIGLLGAITPGTGGTTGTYGGIALTGGSGTNATANITVSGGAVTAVAVVNPGVGYAVGDALSAASGNIGNVTGFSVPVSSVAINQSLAGGSVTYYIPSTQTPKQTWKDAAETILNTNPVQLDGNGCAIVYGSGTYRQILKDSLGNTAWDQLTTSTNNLNPFWAAQAAGTANAITVTDANFNGADGSVINFISLFSNTGPATLNPSSFGAVQITKQSASGPTALAQGDIPAGVVVSVVYRSATSSFQLLITPPLSIAVAPEGYLTPNSDGNNVIFTNGDGVTGALYYSQFSGNLIPIWNGSAFVPTVFNQLVLNLSGSNVANTAYDVCVFLNSGSPTLVTGPSWASSAGGTSSRGTGAGTAQLQRLQGLWVNAVSITGSNNGTTYSIPAQQCTYVGSILTSNTAGNVTLNNNWGQSRQWGVWNAYNQQSITLQVGDSTTNWTYGTNAWRASNGNGNNSALVFTGQLATVDATFTQTLSTTVNNANAQFAIGIGFNSQITPAGVEGQAQTSPVSSQISTTMQATARLSPAARFGVQQLFELEDSLAGNSNMTVNGTQTNMTMIIRYPG